MESLPDPVDCLLSCSGSPYLEVLSGPPIPRKAISGWENVRPHAVYDLTAASHEEPRMRRRRYFTNQALLRDVVSMPNLCAKPYSETQKWPYMSGHLDEDFSYVYTGGLSERSGKANTEAENKKSSHDSQRTSVSTCNLTLDPASLFSSRQSAYVEPRTQYGEISKMFAMQLKPELFAQQLLIEKRLQKVDLNARPDLQKDDIRSGREKSDTKGTDAASLVHAKSSHLQQTRKLRRQRQPKPKMWYPLPANDESHQQLPVDLSFNSRSQANRISTKNPNSDVAINSKTRLHNQYGFGSFHSEIPGKKLPQVRLPRSGEKSNKTIDLKEKRKTATYHIIFDQDKRTQGNSLPPASQAQAWKQEHSQTIPVFVPSLEQEQAMIPKRFSKLTALQVNPSAPSSVVTDRFFNAE